MNDLISRQAAINAMSVINDGICEQQAIDALWELPSIQPENDTGLYVDGFNDGYKQARMDVRHESLTDKEQRIFLAAMGREEKVCEEVDRNYVREPYEDSLVRVCKEIKRKVKGALWT